MRAQSIARVPAVVVVTAALALGACMASDTGTSASLTDHFTLRTEMRALWAAHGTWTRVVLIDEAARLPDADTATAQLIDQQEDIGDALRPFYGDVAADRITQLLRQHITLASALIVAARDGHEAEAEFARASWYENADTLATFLVDLCPQLNRAALVIMLHQHLDQTLAMAAARLSGDWPADIAEYDVVSSHLNALADALAGGITAQFPDRVAPSTMSSANQELHLRLRALWEDRAAWSRFWLIEQMAGHPALPLTADRLIEVQQEIGTAVAGYYGRGTGAQLQSLLEIDVTTMAALVVAAESGERARWGIAENAWVASADQLAAFFAATNPYLSERELRGRFEAGVATGEAQVSARLSGNWDDDVRDYGAGVANSLVISDAIGDGIAEHFAPQLQ